MLYSDSKVVGGKGRWFGTPRKVPFTLVFTPSPQQEMASRILDSSADHDARVRIAEGDVRATDMTKGDLVVFQSALTSLEIYFQRIWNTLELDNDSKWPLLALLVEQKQYCEVTSLRLDNLVSRYDRFLNLVLSFCPQYKGCLINDVTAVELHQYPDGRRDEECLRAKC